MVEEMKFLHAEFTRALGGTSPFLNQLTNFVRDDIKGAVITINQKPHKFAGVRQGHFRHQKCLSEEESSVGVFSAERMRFPRKNYRIICRYSHQTQRLYVEIGFREGAFVRNPETNELDRVIESVPAIVEFESCGFHLPLLTPTPSIV